MWLLLLLLLRALATTADLFLQGPELRLPLLLTCICSQLAT
jgi:hypothetical protein